jgi:hypothetical protein
VKKQLSPKERIMGEPPKLITPGVIAAELGEPLHRILHVLGTRRHIRPTARAGTLRLYDRRAMAMVRHELNAIAARRCQKEVRA